MAEAIVCGRCGTDAAAEYGLRGEKWYCYENRCLEWIDELLRDEGKCSAEKWPPNGDVCGETAVFVNDREALCAEHLEERVADEKVARDFDVWKESRHGGVR